MPDEVKTEAAGAEAAKPEVEKSSAPADTKGAAPPESKDKDEERLAVRQRTLEAERRADKLQKELDSIKEKDLKDQGKWQELAAKHESEAALAKANLRRERIERTIAMAGVRAKANDPEDLVRFVSPTDDVNDSDRDALSDFITTEIEKLTKSKPYLFAQPETKADPNTKDKTAQTKAAPPGGGPRSIDPNRVYTAAEINGMSDEDFRALQKAKGNGAARDIYGRSVG